MGRSRLSRLRRALHLWLRPNKRAGARGSRTPSHPRKGRDLSASRKSNGQEWIRTSEGVCQRIYSLTFYLYLTLADNWRINLAVLRARIKDLPSGVGVTKTTSGRGREFWRVRLGKRFTGGPVVKKDFSNLADARAWIFGEAQNDRAKPGHVLDLKSKAGLSAFELSPAEIAEAAAAIKSCKEAGISLSEAVRFAIKHARPPGGSKSLQEAIDALIKTKAEAGRSARHLRGLRWILKGLPRPRARRGACMRCSGMM
jgi:hypothetical protein